MTEVHSPLRRVLHLLGAAAVLGGYAYSGLLFSLPPWIGVDAVLAVVGWLAFVLLPSRWAAVRTLGRLVAVVAGGVAMGPSQGLLIPPVAIALIALTSELTLPLFFGIGAAVLAGVSVSIGCVIASSSVEAVLALEATVAVWLLIGFARRQVHEREEQATRLERESLAAREEHARAELLAARQAAARDIHDVLAHSLGGLVIQLDAVEALLEAGRVDEAATRIADARSLAAGGLDDARRAVAALRSPERDEIEAALPLSDVAAQLIATHRSLGGAIAFEVDPAVDAASPVVARAVERALQESLSNARRHAPGQPVNGALLRDGAELRLVVANPMPGGGFSREGRRGLGGGHGLPGMAERFAALPGGAVTAQARDARFVVEAHARLDAEAGA